MSTNPNRVPRGVSSGGQFSTGGRREADVDLAPVQTSDPFDGYRLAKVHRMEGREGAAYSGVLTLDGRPVADVTQDGNGGSTFVRFRDRRDERAFAEIATRHSFSEHEPDSAFVDRLETVDSMNRKKAVMFVTDDDDFWGDGDDYRRWGRYRHYRADVTVDDAIQNLSGPAFEAKHPKVWVKERGDFVPVAELMEGQK